MLPHKDRAISKKILILAGDTDGNIGDLAIVTATCERLRSVLPDVQIALVSSRPERDKAHLNVIPLRRGWRGLIGLARWAREADLVICGGGGLFQDDDSLIKMPYWAVRLLLVRLLARRVAGLSIGAGPLRYPSSRLFARLAICVLSPCSVRDELARSVLQPLTRKHVEVVPDPAFMLRAAPEGTAEQVLRNAGVPTDKPLIGVALRRCFHTSSNVIPHRFAASLGLDRGRGETMMTRLIDSVASALNDVISQLDAHVVLMPTYNVQHEDDAAVCQRLADKLPRGRHSLLRIDAPQLYQAVTARVSLMLCGRMHAAILAASQGTPVVGLAYNQKFFGMLSMIGQGSRCFSVADFVQNGKSPPLTAMLLESIRDPLLFKPETEPLAQATAAFIENLVAEAFLPAATAEPRTEAN